MIHHNNAYPYTAACIHVLPDGRQLHHIRDKLWKLVDSAGNKPLGYLIEEVIVYPAPRREVTARE